MKIEENNLTKVRNSIIHKFVLENLLSNSNENNNDIINNNDIKKKSNNFKGINFYLLISYFIFYPFFKKIF